MKKAEKKSKPGKLTVLVGGLIGDGLLSTTERFYYENKIGEQLGLDYDEGRVLRTHLARHLLLEETANLPHRLSKVRGSVPDWMLAPPLFLEGVIQHTAQLLKDRAEE